MMEQIDISEIVQDFRHHVVMNKNIILSGAFGSGKSYMLDEFKRKYSCEFKIVTIFPINYTISGNADIVEYIKHDIIYQLVLQGYITEHTDFSAVSDSIFTTENLTKLTERLLEKIPGGGLISEAIRIGIETSERHDCEKHAVADYLEGFNKVGSIYERDIYTEMIRVGLDNGRRDGMQWMLIIEDLDRIDPHNIFRLLNVFGAHLDYSYITGEEVKTNKFGFDKIVFVLDYRQTSEIYNRYFGLESENSWEGYISKFLSSQPFYFEGVAAAAKGVVLRSIAQDCRIDYKIIETLFPHEYSIRTLSKVTFEGFESFLRKEKVELSDGSAFAADCRFTRLLYYLHQLDGGINQLGKILEEKPVDYLEIVAPALLYHRKESSVFIDHCRLKQSDDYEDYDVNDNSEEDYEHTYYHVGVTSDGAIEIKEVKFAIVPAHTIDMKISEDDSFAIFVVNYLSDFCSRFTRYSGN